MTSLIRTSALHARSDAVDGAGLVPGPLVVETPESPRVGLPARRRVSCEMHDARPDFVRLARLSEDRHRAEQDHELVALVERVAVRATRVAGEHVRRGAVVASLQLQD